MRLQLKSVTGVIYVNADDVLAVVGPYEIYDGATNVAVRDLWLRDGPVPFQIRDEAGNMSAVFDAIDRSPH